MQLGVCVAECVVNISSHAVLLTSHQQNDPFVALRPDIGIRKTNLLEGTGIVDPIFEYASHLARAIKVCGKNRIVCGLCQVRICFSFLFSHSLARLFFLCVSFSCFFYGGKCLVVV